MLEVCKFLRSLPLAMHPGKPSSLDGSASVRTERLALPITMQPASVSRRTADAVSNVTRSRKAKEPPVVLRPRSGCVAMLSCCLGLAIYWSRRYYGLAYLNDDGDAMERASDRATPALLVQMSRNRQHTVLGSHFYQGPKPVIVFVDVLQVFLDGVLARYTATLQQFLELTCGCGQYVERHHDGAAVENRCRCYANGARFHYNRGGS